MQTAANDKNLIILSRAELQAETDKAFKNGYAKGFERGRKAQMPTAKKMPSKAKIKTPDGKVLESRNTVAEEIDSRDK